MNQYFLFNLILLVMENTAFTGDDESEKNSNRVEEKENGKAPKEVRN